MSATRWSVLEHWHAGTVTRRVTELHRAMPAAAVVMHSDDAKAREFVRQGVVWIESRRGRIRTRVETGGRSARPRQPVRQHP